jgi:NO-binding membrane sensor protein with MHYT domain
MGILIFVVFSFEGALMSSKLSHSVGAINDNSNWWVIGWSKTVGDLRVSHFIGMHAFQLQDDYHYFIALHSSCYNNISSSIKRKTYFSKHKNN